MTTTTAQWGESLTLLVAHLGIYPCSVSAFVTQKYRNIGQICTLVVLTNSVFDLTGELKFQLSQLDWILMSINKSEGKKEEVR